MRSNAKPKILVERYEYKNARAPSQFACPPLSVRTTLVSITDPNQNVDGPGTERILAIARFDVLEKELQLYKSTDGKSGISPAAYEAGKRLAGALENLRHTKQSSLWKTSGRVDGAGDPDFAGRKLVTGEYNRNIRKEAELAIGVTGLRSLERFLVDGWGFGKYAEMTGKGSGRAATAQIANGFRLLLENLADYWGAEGANNGRIRADRN